MKLTFYGGVREVTGSKHILEVGRERVLLDCGMFQGRRAEARKRNSHLPFNAKLIRSVILSHAHIDHSGILPVLGPGSSLRLDGPFGYGSIGGG